MKLLRYIALAAFLAIPASANAQACSGVFASGAVCGNGGASSAPAGGVPFITLFQRNFGSTANAVFATNGGGTPALTTTLPSGIAVPAASLTGTVSAAHGGFGVDVSASSGVPLFAAGVPTFTSTTGTGNFARAISPALTGVPTAPTAAPGTNTTQIATTEFVITNGAPVTSVFGRIGAIVAQLGDYTAAIINYTASATGAVARTIANKFMEMLSIGDFNVTCDGSTDDATKIQNAANAAAKGKLYINPSASGCKINTGIVLSDNIVIEGVGLSGGVDVTSIGGGSRIIPANGVTAFTITTSKPVEIRNLSIAYGSQQTGATACITFNPTGTATGNINANSRIRNVSCYYADRAFRMLKSSNWLVADCYIWSANVGFEVSNSISPDAGDSEIRGCESTMATSAGIYNVFHESSSELRLTQNKWNGGQVSYFMSWTNTNGTASGACNGAGPIAVGGSNEGMLLGYYFSRQGSSCTVVMASMSGVQFGVIQASGAAVQVPTDGSSSDWIKNVSITGGSIDGPSSVVGSTYLVDFSSGAGVSSVGVPMRSNNALTGRHRVAPTTSNPVIGLSTGSGTFAASAISGMCGTSFGGGVNVLCYVPY